jgi:hypothetical protein
MHKDITMRKTKLPHRVIGLFQMLIGILKMKIRADLRRLPKQEQEH